ncbi:MAG: response regulator [Bdellovibrionales bacterium]|nr:response regulator [Bdellovibrionales bacterium]
MASLNEIKEFFTNQLILILDTSRSTREMVKTILLEYNVDPVNILATENYDKAVSFIKEKKPIIIFTDIQINEHSGIGLLHKVSEYAPKVSDRLFYVITSNADETAVAEAAEEDVDGYVLKPFSKEYFVNYIESTIEEKIRPSSYFKEIESGKELLEENELEMALEHFSSAKKMNDKPSLACFYSGEAQRRKKNSLNALLEFEEGLEINPIHYRCLVGKFETLDELKQTEEAYGVVRTLTKYFPVSPQRLGKIFKLAVFTHNFSDAKKYYELFEKIERKSLSLRKIVAAALKVSGKFLLNHNDQAGALEAFKNAIISSKLDPALITDIVSYLIEKNRIKDAEELLKFYPGDNRNSEDFLNLDFQITALSGHSDIALSMGKNLIDDKAARSDVYLEMANIFVSQRRLDAAENILYQGIQNLPDQREVFSNKIKSLENK